LRMADGHRRSILADTDIKHSLNVLDFSNKHVVHGGSCFGVDVVLDRLALRKLLEIL
jgi:Zn-dependent alcohol dehydrogenase